MARRKLPWPSECPPSRDGLAGQVAWLWEYFAREATGNDYNYAKDEGQLFPPLTRGEALSMTVAMREALASRGERWPLAQDLIAAQMDAPRPGVIAYTMSDRGKPYRYPLRMWDAWRAAGELTRAIPTSSPMALPNPNAAWCALIARAATDDAKRDIARGVKRKLPDPETLFPRLPRVSAGLAIAVMVIAIVLTER